MRTYPYHCQRDQPQPPTGLIVLQTDETLEIDLHRTWPHQEAPVYLSRIPSAPEVTFATLSAMSKDITRAASLLPPLTYGVVAYGCTSASAVIGSDAVANQVRAGCKTQAVTDPFSAAIARLQALGIARLAMLSPYIEEACLPLVEAFRKRGVIVEEVGSFHEPDEQRVARIAAPSLVEAACDLGASEAVEGLFLSCTNLRTMDVIPLIESRLGKPVLSSNSALIWHMRQLAFPNGTLD